MSNYQNEDIRFAARVFGALSNPNRLQIFLRLVSCCGVGTRWRSENAICPCVGDLGRDLGVAPSTVSHHIKELHQAGLIQLERRGKYVDCWIEPGVLERLTSFFKEPHAQFVDLAALSSQRGASSRKGRNVR